MTEAQLQDAIRLELGKHPALCLWRNNIGRAKIRGYWVAYGVGGPGAADLIGLFRGRFVALEIKTPIGRQSPEQRTFQSLVERKGGVYAVLRSVADAAAWLVGMESTCG
jgi:hypothetical protein